MNAMIQLQKATSRLPQIVLMLISFALAPLARGLVPPPDGCYPNYTTAEGCQALRLLTTGTGNTAVGWYSLYSAGAASYNTGVGAGALAFTTGTRAVDNTAVGAGAMLFNISGASNVAVGTNALHNNDTGFYNVAVGTEALHDNDTGIYNYAVGALALYHNIDGSGNSAFGFEALFLNTHAGGNTAIGHIALGNNDSTGHGLANDNTAIGRGALYSNTDGDSNTAVGSDALANNNTGRLNTATGVSALEDNTTGHDNNAVGYAALANNTVGALNQAMGAFALGSNEDGDSNIAIGDSALTTNAHGSFNTVVGWAAGATVEGDNNIYVGAAAAAGVGSESGTIRIGDVSSVDACYIAGIRGATATNGAAVFVDLNGKLGTVTSSARFKDDIKPMDNASESILALKPVMFRYKNHIDAKPTRQFGLIAEEVEAINPDLVVRDKEGKPYGVRYEQVNAMLLNEFLKEHRKNEKQEATIACLRNQIEALTARLEKVSDQIEMSKVAASVARNN
jgi:Chaperone of endosialidase